VDAPSLRIRAAEAADLDCVLELWAAARNPHARIEDNQEVLARLRARDPEALLVAEVDGRIVGTVIAAFDGWRGNMYRLAVDPAERRRGIGSALIGEGEMRIRALGGRRITALIDAEDDDARAFWAAARYDHDPYIARYVKNV
jgi:ribosomal protein S18 acetylase RimI-like enzyme